MQEFGQIFIQFPIVGAFIWYTIVMVGKFEKFVIKMQEDQQEFIGSRDSTQKEMMEKFSIVIERNSGRMGDLEGAVKKLEDAITDLIRVKKELIKKIDEIECGG